MFEEHCRFCSECARFSYPDDSLVCIGCLNKPNKPNWVSKTESSSGNPYWENICAIADRQRAKGMTEYGKGLEDNKASIIERINHAQEEAVDFLMYLEWIKDKFGGDPNG